jgi:hypothetical protein
MTSDVSGGDTASLDNHFTPHLAKPRTLRLPNLEPSFAKPQSECQSEREHLRLIAGSEFKSDG